MYCVYLTIYRGNKNNMPPFYIGSSSVDKVKNGYRGTVESIAWYNTWKEELKDNPHLFETKIICEYFTRKEALEKEYKLQISLDILKKPTIYINRAIAAKNGFFGREVKGKDHPNYGKDFNGKNNPRYGHPCSAKHKEQLSKLARGRPSGNNGKRYKWITNGTDNKFLLSDDIIPEGWIKGRTI